MHEFQKCMHACHADGCHNCGNHCCQNQCISYCLAHLIHFSRTILLRGQYGKTGSQSQKKTYDQKYDGSC